MTNERQATAISDRMDVQQDASRVPGNQSVPMALDDVQRTYRIYAPIYDASFGFMVSHYQKRLVRSCAFAPGARVLEVGVGTGLSLPLYPGDVRVTGIDASAAMLQKAGRRVEQLGLKNIELQVKDAEHSGFDDAAFDCIMLMFVLSVTPNPTALLREARRLCRRGGDIYILNHFGGSTGFGLLERCFQPLARWVGFRSDMPLSIVREISEGNCEIRSLSPLGFFKLVHIRA